MNLFARLLLFCGLCVLPSAILATWHVFQDRREAYASVSRMALNVAREHAGEQRRIGEGADQLLHALSLLPEVREHQSDACNRTFRRLYNQFTIYQVIGAAEPDGRIWCSSRAIDGADLSGEDYFREAVRTHRFTNGGFSRFNSLSFVLPVYEQGRLVTVLHTALDLERLHSDLEKVQLPPASTLMVLDPQGRVLVEEPRATHIGQRLPPGLLAAVANERPGVIDATWIDGRRRYIGHVPAPIDGAKPLTVLLAVDRASAFAAANARWAHTLLLTSLILAIGLAIAWWVAALGIRKPIARLLAVMESWRRGDHSARFGSLPGAPEIRELGSAFDSMADAVEDRERRLADVLESTTDFVVTLDRELRVTFMNQRARARMGGREMLGQEMGPQIRAAWGEDNWAILQRSAAERVPARVSFTARTGHFEVHIFPSGEGGVTLFGRELTEQHRAQEELRYLALHDQLTGLPNRKSMEDFAANALAAGDLVALILLDLDGFKHVNDTLGHPAGDEVLRDVAARLSIGLAGNGLLARLGGDEFVALMTRQVHPDQVEQIATDLLKALERQPFLIRGRMFRITASAGLAFVPTTDSTDPDALLANADLALYRAKGLGGGVCRTFNACDRQHYEAERLLEEELGLAVERGEFELYYQPQVRLADGMVVGAEALLRWNHPRRGLLSPVDFLSVLEESRYARRMGSWILGEACRQAGEWRRAGLPLRIGVNLFAEQIKAGDLVEVVGTALQRADLPPEALTLELTENIALGQEESVLTALRTLHAQGVGVDFDDFGTGFASLTTLRDFPLTRLKIDRSFITQLPDAAHDAAIVEAVLALARSLKLDVVAEGIETEAQANFLMSRGCSEGQGYLYGKPEPASVFLAGRPTNVGTPAEGQAETSRRLRRNKRPG